MRGSSGNDKDRKMVFVDGSYSPQHHIGVGAYLILDRITCDRIEQLDIADLKMVLMNQIVYHVFQNIGGSTQTEQRILNLALRDPLIDRFPFVYTDCQKSRSTNKYTVIHVKGHAKQQNRHNSSKIFDVVDKAARKKLRSIIKNK